MEAVIGDGDDFEMERQIISISQDSFYRELTAEESEKALKGLFNFDHPGSASPNVIIDC